MTQFGLVVGVGRFEKNLDSLEYIENDANAVYAALLTYFPIEYEDVYIHINDQATKENIEESISAIKEKARAGDRVIIYFATHGKTIWDASYLACYNAENNDENDNDGWISISKIIAAFRDVHCNVMAFLDCCASTQYCILRSVSDGDVVEDERIESKKHDGGYAVVFAAAGEDQAALSDPANNHGIWTYYLLNAFQGHDVHAFSPNTTRVTIESLREYLCTKVPEKASSLYHRTQTPYLWGTFSENTVIVEHKEVYGLKIGDIFFGEIDTDTERKSALSQDIIKSNFYDLNSVCSKIIETDKVLLIIGNKGTGKTYLGEYLQSNNDKTYYQSLKGIQPSDIQVIADQQANERGKYTVAWQYAIYTFLSCLIVNKNELGADKLLKLLRNIYGSDIDMILGSFASRKKNLFDKKIKNTISLKDDFIAYNSSSGKTTVRKMVWLYQDLLKEAYDSTDTYFLLDGLDEFIRGEITQKQKNYLLDLIDAVSQSRDDMPNVHIMLMLRDDVLEGLNGEANINKIRTGRSELLQWASTNTNYKMTPLYQFLEKRLKNSEMSKGDAYTKSLEDILPSKMQNSDTWPWILELTTYTPRDIIAFFNCSKDFAGEQFYFTEDDLWAATRPYSDYLWKEFQDILAGTVLSDQSGALENLFERIGRNHNIYQKPTSFTYSEFKTEYDNIQELSNTNISEALKVLYEAGIMCIHPKGRDLQYSYFREEPVKYDQELWKESTFDIHKGLWKKLHIW